MNHKGTEDTEEEGTAKKREQEGRGNSEEARGAIPIRRLSFSLRSQLR